MADTHANHPYHMVQPSPWPILGAGSAFIIAVGAIMYMHEGGPWVFFAGLAARTGTSRIWLELN